MECSVVVILVAAPVTLFIAAIVFPTVKWLLPFKEHPTENIRHVLRGAAALSTTGILSLIVQNWILHRFFGSCGF